MSKNQYKRMKNKTILLYKEINFVICAAPGNEKVYFDSSGFRHMVYKGKDLRPIPDQMRRFKLFPHAPCVIKEAVKIESCSDFSDVRFWSLHKTIGEITVATVIRQIGNGKKHFFSVMPKKRKDPRKGL